jgi:hypothetical protein
MLKTHDKGSKLILILKEEKGGKINFRDNAYARIVLKRYR